MTGSLAKIVPGRVRRLAATVLALACGAAGATSDPLTGVLSADGAAGLGAAWRFERSPYRGAGTRVDFVPLYLYEGRYAYLHAYRAGLKLDSSPVHRFDVFVAHRFEGFPYDRVPASLAGMAERAPGADLGLAYERRLGWGALYGEYLHDFVDASGGRELRLGYKNEWRAGRLRLRPHAMLALRDAKLNDYYYGVLPAEATPARPAYAPGAGVNAQLGLYGAYALTERWRLLAGISATRWPRAVRSSPIVVDRFESSAVLGLLYDFSPEHEAWPEKRPLYLKLYYGRATECDVLKVVRLVCTSTATPEQTRVAAIELGRPFVERLNGWPLDFVGYLGLLRHEERGFQADFSQVNAYMKAYWYGFPWSGRVRTRLGLGVGVSYARHVPVIEARDQARRGRNTSELLNYLDPTLDVNLGDLLRARSLKGTRIGLGVSHRSGIFGTSQLLGNVDGGSNYIYSFVEFEL
jgi:outer membrane protein